MIARSMTLVCVLAGAVLASACSDTTTTATSPSPVSPVTEVFNGQFAVGGGASRAFTAASAGTVTVTLSSLGPPADAVVGLGVGIPSANQVGCYLTQSLTASASSTPQITVTVDAGTYCVRVFDIGTLASQIAFQITIVRP
jgi:hypothetical protein